MPFNRKPQKFNAAIKSVVIGSGDKTVTLGGENVLPFYAFDGEIKNGPKVGVEITDLGMEGEPESVKAYYEGAATMGEIAKKAAAMEGADFLCLRLAGGDPNGLNKSVEELIETVKEVADAVDVRKQALLHLGRILLGQQALWTQYYTSCFSPSFGNRGLHYSRKRKALQRASQQ